MKEKIEQLISEQKDYIFQAEQQFPLFKKSQYQRILDAEISLRNSFISDLENILDPAKLKEIKYDEKQDKF